MPHSSPVDTHLAVSGRKFTYANSGGGLATASSPSLLTVTWLALPSVGPGPGDTERRGPEEASPLPSDHGDHRAAPAHGDDVRSRSHADLQDFLLRTKIQLASLPPPRRATPAPSIAPLDLAPPNAGADP